MNENFVDIIIYLYENYMGEDSVFIDDTEIEEHLIEAGFSEREIDKAFDWIGDLAEHIQESAFCQPGGDAIRIYSPFEQERLSLEVRGFLLTMEQTGILDPLSRELVIDGALALDDAVVEVDDIRWIVLLVLMGQPGREEAFSRMEAVIYQETPSIH